MSGCYRYMYRGHEHSNINASPVTSLLLVLCCAGEREKTVGHGEGREGRGKVKSTQGA